MFSSVEFFPPQTSGVIVEHVGSLMGLAPGQRVTRLSFGGFNPEVERLGEVVQLVAIEPTGRCVCLSVCLSVCLFVCLFVCLYECLSVFHTVCPCVCA